MISYLKADNVMVIGYYMNWSGTRTMGCKYSSFFLPIRQLLSSQSKLYSNSARASSSMLACAAQTTCPDASFSHSTNKRYVLKVVALEIDRATLEPLHTHSLVMHAPNTCQNQRYSASTCLQKCRPASADVVEDFQ
jgi:hypothetical protein